MITPLLQNALAPLVEHHRRLRSLFASGVAWFCSAAVGLGFLLGETSRMGAFCAAVGAFVIVRFAGRWWVSRWQPDYRQVAVEIEGQHPELHALLRTAVEQRPDPKTGQLHFLQQKVVTDAVAATRQHQWLDSIPNSRWAGGYAAQWLGIIAFGLTFWYLKPHPQQVVKAEPTPAPVAVADALTVTPGDTELERGSGLVVLAKFHRDLPSEAVLVVQSKNQPAQRLPLVRNLGDPVYGGGLPEVDADLTYRIEYAGQATRDFTVKVFEHPRLERADATLDYPAYTKLPGKKIPDTHRITAVEGTKLGVAFQLNKPVKSATLIAKDGSKVPLTVQDGKPLAELPALPLRASQTYELKLEDADGRTNKIPAQFIVEVLPNRRPQIKIATPKGDSRVSPLEEVTFRADVWDDFGIARYGLNYSIAGGESKDIELGSATAPDEKRALSYLLKLEETGVKPDALISWHLWAEDTGHDGQIRRTASDLYFAEVRPFEEIYRQGEDEEGEGKPGQSGEAEKLAGIQKQIVSATWNLQRSEAAAAQPSAKYLKDEPVVRDSQTEALAQARAMGAKLQDSKSKGLAENVAKEMQTAIERLNDAAKSTEPLPRALAAEQSAYNALLKLSAHQFSVKQQKAKSGQASQRNQDQLDELELKQDEKRYEAKSEADQQQNEQQREQLTILNRLKELAQRQNDINERIKELQTAMQEAKTDKEKEDLKRQLKRLREEEQQMLADIDELKQKMEQSSQQAQLADEKKQLDQTRSEAQKAAEAMEQNAPSQALANGTRAARELQQMREDFRKKTSNQFRDEMREMRSDARELADRQQDIADKLKEGATAKQERPTLDGSSDKEKLTEQFEKQKSKLGKLTEDMKRVSEQAEAAEPLLAKELYDTLRKTTQTGTGDTLEKTQKLAQSGYAPQAQKFEEKARQEINDLKQGVERAAESVLGDEAEALRQARAELDALAQQLKREVAKARPDLAAAADKDGKQFAGGDAKDQPKDGDKKATAAGQGKDGKENGEAKPDGKTMAAAGAQSGQKEGAQPSPEGSQKTASADGKGDQPGGKEAKAGEGKNPGQTAQQNGAPGQQPGEKGGEGKTPGQTAQQNGGQQPGPGQQPGKGQQPQAGQPGQTAQAGQPGQGSQQANARGGDSRQREGGKEGRGGLWGGAAEGNESGPMTGEKFVEWQDRLRNVEEMLDAPELRNEAARVREIAKGVRAEFKRHSVPPSWEMVDRKIRAPLAELRDRVTEELARRESKENLVPIDRDPVPTKYAERVRRYYEDLGRSER